MAKTAERHAKTCPMTLVQKLVAGKWKLILLWQLNSGTKRFNELRKLLPSVSQRILTQQLRDLEHDGLVHREVFRVVPPRVEYSLTPTGRSFVPVMESMCVWGKTHIKDKKAGGA